MEELLKWVDESTGARVGPPSMLTVGLAKVFIARIYLEQERWFKAYRFGKAASDELRALI